LMRCFQKSQLVVSGEHFATLVNLTSDGELELGDTHETSKPDIR
jgi:hypothetical protein